MASSTSPSRASCGYWRAAAIFLLVVLAIGMAAGVSMFEQFSAQVRDLQQKVQKTAQLQNLSVLLDDKAEPAMLVTLQAGDGALQLQRLNAVVEGREDTMQLWALADTGRPRSLGVVQNGIKTPRIAVNVLALSGIKRLAISVENKGGVEESQGPRLPYLFSGVWVHKAI